MSAANRALLERLFAEFWTAGRMEVAADLFAPDFTVHNGDFPMPAGALRGPTLMQAGWQSVHAAFPDLQFRVEDLVAEEGKVACRWTSEGTHRGAFFGVAATGRRVTYAGLTLFHVREGRFVEAWVADNTLSLLEQLRASA